MGQLQGREGRALAELLAALAIAGLIGSLLMAMQVHGYRWSQADQRRAAALGAPRNAVDIIARDLRVAYHFECCADGILAMHQRHEVDLLLITYRLEGDRLVRSLVRNYDPATVQEWTVVRGLTRFELTAMDERIRVRLESAPSATERPGPLQTELIWRLGVMP